MSVDNCRNILVLLGLGDAENAVHELLQAMPGSGASTSDTEDQINRILRAKHIPIDARAILAMLRARGMLDVYGTRVFMTKGSRANLQAVKPRVIKAENLSEVG